MPWLGALILLVACHRQPPVPTASPAGPFALVCSQPAVAVDGQQAENQAVSLWLRGLTAPERQELLGAIASLTADLETIGFGGRALVDGDPAAPLLQWMDRLAPGLAATRALAQSTELRPACPVPLPSGCRCEPLTQRAPTSYAGTLRASIWPLTDGVCLRRPTLGRAAAVARLRRCSQMPDSAVALIFDAAGRAQAQPDAQVRTAAQRLSRRLQQSGQPIKRIETLLKALQTVPAPSPTWLAAEPACIWVWPRLGRIAGSPLLSQVAECLDQRQGAKLLGGEL